MPYAVVQEGETDEGDGQIDFFDEVAFAQLEQSLTEEYARYWQQPLSRGATLENIQQTLQQAENEYQTRSGVVYAMFVPPGTETDTPYTSVLSQRLLSNDVSDNADELLLMFIPPTGNPIQQRVKVNRRQIQRQAALFGLEISSFLDNGYQPLARQLYDWLLTPIEEEIRQNGVENLMYVLDSGLSTIPLSAMMTGDTFAVERYGLSVLPSVGLLQTDFGEAPAPHTVLAGGSAQFAELEALPAVPVELGLVESVATASQVFLNEDFEVDNLRTAQAIAPKAMVHVATHAEFNPGALDRSFIQFWDEQLTLEGLGELGLQDLELLILSACTTALGSRDAELGFAGLAAAAGVEASIGSLWNVSDMGTMALMAEFYEQLRGNPLRASALRQAQLSLLQGNTRIEAG
ncbi:MAG: CHAT domain-containing protein, partial [Cyanobacteria bacterium J06632_3]